MTLRDSALSVGPIETDVRGAADILQSTLDAYANVLAPDVLAKIETARDATRTAIRPIRGEPT